MNRLPNVSENLCVEFCIVWLVRPFCTSENGSGDTDIQYQFLPSGSEGEVAVLVVING